MKRMKAVIAYDGSGFAGYQIQPEARTIQMELMKVLKNIHKGRDVQVLSLIHISEPTRLGMISYAVFCLKKKNTHLRAHETRGNLVCRLLLEKKKKKKKKYMLCAV